jgi:hypothetical protein
MSDKSNKAWDAIKASDTRLTSLRARVKTDRELFMGKLFELKDKNNKPLKTVVNVTSNDPVVFGIKSMSFLGGAARQTVVKGRNLPDKTASEIEAFIDYMFEQADIKLATKGLLPLHQSLVNYACLDGWLVSKGLVYADASGSPIFDVIPNDIVLFNYDMGKDGLLWGAPKYKRSKAQIDDEYGKLIGSRFDVPADGGYIHDYYDAELNIIFFQKLAGDLAEVVEERKNDTGIAKPPFGLQPVALTPMLSDDLKYFGESIYQANRNHYDQKDTILTILQTINVQGWRAPLQMATDKKVAKEKAQEYTVELKNLYESGSMLFTGQNDKLYLVPVRDISNSAPFLYSIIDSEIQRGGLPNIDFGNLTFPLSAVAITQLAGHKDTIYLPRFQAISMIYRQLAKLLIDQFIAGSYSLKLKSPNGKDINYTKKLLSGDYTISFRFSAVAPAENLANLSAARTAKAVGLSQQSIFQDIMHLQNPTEEMRRVEEEQTEYLVPSLKLYRTAKHMLQDAEKLGGDDAESKIAEATLIMKAIGLDIKGNPLPQTPTATPLPADQTATQTGADTGASGLPLGAEMPPTDNEAFTTQLEQSQGRKKPARGQKK